MRASDQAIQFGYGWADLFNPTVTQIDTTTARVINSNAEQGFAPFARVGSAIGSAARVV